MRIDLNNTVTREHPNFIRNNTISIFLSRVLGRDTHTYTHTSWNWATSVDLLYSLLWLTVLYKHVICCYELEEQICIPSSHIIVYICHGRSVILIVCTQTLRDIVLVYRSVCSKLERKFCCINPDTGEKIGKPQAYNCSI